MSKYLIIYKIEISMEKDKDICEIMKGQFKLIKIAGILFLILMLLAYMTGRLSFLN